MCSHDEDTASRMYRGTDRGVSPIIGFVLIVAFLVLALGIYQANIVPFENQQREFTHYQEVQSDMIQLRNEIVQVGATNRLGTAAVDLGTDYPDRSFAINPAPAQGSLRTEPLTGSIEVSGVNTTAICGLGDQTPTKAITYQPSYNYLNDRQAPPFYYENSVLYRELPDGEVLVASGQSLVQGRTINLIPFAGNISVQGTRTESIDIVGDQSGVADESAEVRLTIPTRLDASQWAEIMEGVKNVNSVQQNTSTTVDINLARDAYTIRCTPTGAGSSPDVSITATGERDEINPASAGDIKLENEFRGKGQTAHVVTLQLNNSAGIDQQIVSARINFFQNKNDDNKDPVNAEIRNATTDTPSGTLEFREDFVKLSPKINLRGNRTITDVELVFYANQEQTQEATLDSGDWFVLSLVYSSGEAGTYFIPVPK